jgi:hypothetical protein
MPSLLRILLAAGFLFVSLPGLTAGEDKDELVDNPIYAAWKDFKPGSTSTVLEKTTYSTDKSGIPEHKQVTYKLLSVSPEKVVVQAVVFEDELLGVVESAPTKHHYRAKLKKSYLAVAAPDLNAKKGEESVKWKPAGGKEKTIKCKTLTGSYKKESEAVEFKAWMNDSIPGGVVKRTRTTKTRDETVSTTVTLLSYKVAE